MTKPFEIGPSDIKHLIDIQLTDLLRNLLVAEAQKFGIALSVAEVASNINAGDGGEDGRISWEDGPEYTDFFPKRLTLFQNKATEMTPKDYANEIVTTSRKSTPSVLKPNVEEVLDRGGAYIFFTTQELNKKQKNKRIAAIREKIRELGKTYADTCCIKIYDAAQISMWVNNFTPTIISVQHWSGRPMERGLKTFDMWNEDQDLSILPFANVDSRKEILDELAEKIIKPKSCFRLIGLSGLGKTRTALQVFKTNNDLKNLAVYVDANHVPRIDALIADWIPQKLKAILVVDNCDYRLHERLVKEVRRTDSQISLLTLDYNMENVLPSTVCFQLKPMTNEELLQLLTPEYKEILPDLERVASFAQGFPQLAVLLAKARLEEDPRIGELTEDELANKLLWKRDEAENPERLKILQVCSLFDVFGIENEAENQLKFIASLVGLPIDNIYECIQDYTTKGLIDRRGRYGQVVPKPLAIRLAGQWWAKTREKRQLELVKSIPEEMIEGFCDQIERMDFHTNVKELSEKLCGPLRPFGQAEVILSDRGSRLFRSFVVVNPEASCSALYKFMRDQNIQQLSAITGTVRRNLVWALEKLCFHADIFSEAAWCMLLLASAENEPYGNNATETFAGFFKIFLSGTAANPKLRLKLLNRALELHLNSVDMVVLKALEQAVSTRGGSRIVGAEYQGNRAPLKEWEPKIWQDIFDYWQEVFNLLISMLERGEAQKEKVLSIVGQSIRGLVNLGRLEMLDSAIKNIVAINGRYWPSAWESIKDALTYDSDTYGSEEIKTEVSKFLNSWLRLLNPDDADLSEKLKILVINPPWEHRKGDDGHYIDVAYENAKALGTEVAHDIDSLIPYLHMLLHGEQKQTYNFGYQLSRILTNLHTLIDLSFEHLVATDSANPSFVLGIYRGIFERSPEQWQKNIDKLLANKRFVHFYPEFIRTGIIQKSHLNQLLKLIRDGDILPNSINALSYGNVTSDIDPETMIKFCMSLVEFNDNAGWISLNMIYMYYFSNKESIKIIREPLKQLVSKVPLHREQDGTRTDVYRWNQFAVELLKEPDEEFATALAKQLIAACHYGLTHSDIWNYAKPLLLDLMHEYGDTLWPIFKRAIVQSKDMERYWLQRLFSRENSFSNKLPSVLSVLPIDSVISWCKEQPVLGPSFVASCVNIFDISDQRPTDLFVKLLVEFGDDKRVTSALKGNMGTRGWSGSLVPYLKSDKQVLSTLLDHDSDNVRRWVEDQILYIDQQIAVESIKDEEMDFGIH